MSESQRLQRNKLFAKGLKKTATYAVMITADILKAILGFIKMMISTAIGKK
ncbi:MAG: hypothetical protein HN981_05350 [Candidatus Pacebacteria bacterium]|jgi:hypothetical protein|nr:hypothetical protein [Candidatus Paceibacterota bacterium]MBT4652215.1 hypothetical protein [Candidatus Paceibacterota bacterium]MBT6756586.1 hypothetical protein [Candidatus Paceibacterota bacterium]MBT6921790.1 hypothetical protein [Candidatus Paceibacterota bacterium]